MERRFYVDVHPTVEQTYAVVEIAYTSLQFDRGVKRRVYGAGRVPEYWIVDVKRARSKSIADRTISVTPRERIPPRRESVV